MHMCISLNEGYNPLLCSNGHTRVSVHGPVGEIMAVLSIIHSYSIINGLWSVKIV